MENVLRVPCDYSTRTNCVRAAKRSPGTLPARVTRFVLWAAAIGVMLYGARWLLEQPFGGSEFAAATYVFSDAHEQIPARIATRPAMSTERSLHE